MKAETCSRARFCPEQVLIQLPTTPGAYPPSLAFSFSLLLIYKAPLAFTLQPRSTFTPCIHCHRRLFYKNCFALHSIFVSILFFHNNFLYLQLISSFLLPFFFPSFFISSTVFGLTCYVLAYLLILFLILLLKHYSFIFLIYILYLLRFLH